MDIKNPEPENWVDIIPEKENVLTSVSLIYNHFIVEYRKDVSDKLDIYEIDGKKNWEKNKSYFKDSYISDDMSICSKLVEDS